MDVGTSNLEGEEEKEKEKKSILLGKKPGKAKIPESWSTG